MLTRPVALYESYFDAKAVRQTRQRLAEQDEDEMDEDPTSDEGEISKVAFDDLVKTFPDLTASATSAIMREVQLLRKEVAALKLGSPPPPSIKQEDGGK